MVTTTAMHNQTKEPGRNAEQRGMFDKLDVHQPKLLSVPDWRRLALTSAHLCLSSKPTLPWTQQPERNTNCKSEIEGKEEILRKRTRNQNESYNCAQAIIIEI